MDSKRLACLKALTAHLSSEITLGNGYKHTLTNAVFRGRMFIDDDDPLPCVSILENINPDRFPIQAGGHDAGGPLVQSDNWILLLQGWADDDKANPTDPAYELMADVKKALAKINDPGDPTRNTPAHANYLLGGLVMKIGMEPGTVRPPDQNSAKAYFWIRIVLKFIESVSDPFDHT